MNARDKDFESAALEREYGERIAAAMREFNAAVMQAEEESLLVETKA